MTHNTQPFYQKLGFTLLSLALICAALYYGGDIILPVMVSILLAALLLPATNFLNRKGLPKALSITIPIVVTVVLGASVLYLLSAQILNFADDMPALKERVNGVISDLQKWIRANTHITVRKQNEYVNQTLENLKEGAPRMASATFGSITDFLAYSVLLPVYTFLILYYRTLIKKFLIDVFKNGSEERVSEILTGSTAIAQRYILGLMIETSVVFALNTTGFLILGINYAIFLALLAALLNVIPYVGMLVANVICMFVTLISSDSTADVLWVGAILAVVQIIDNNILMPAVVGNHVRINSMATIVGVLVGGALCGMLGMFLAIPILAVSKVICDHVPDLKPWGDLLGDGTPAPSLPILHTKG